MRVGVGGCGSGSWGARYKSMQILIELFLNHVQNDQPIPKIPWGALDSVTPNFRAAVTDGMYQSVPIRLL